MKRRSYVIEVSLIALLVGSAPVATAAFNPVELEKSLVRITVTGGGKKASAGTGFVWRNPHHVVTSLHLMRNGRDVEITVDHKKVRRTATVDRVLIDSDLVLLKITEPWGNPKFTPTALSRIGGKPPTESKMMALGFHANGPVKSRQMVKGYSNPEVLKSQLPLEHQKRITKLGFPRIDLPIYYLEVGSLLPGFSGSPVVDTGGVLIGVGDGGLDKGQSGVSWVIPATHLEKLTSSKVRKLPENMGSVAELFSVDVESPETYVAVSFNGYEFVKTKTRTFSQLLESTDDPEGLEDIATSWLSEYNVDYSSFKYDIYEDVNNGLIIALPAEKLLLVDDDDGLTVNYHEDSPWDISYKVLSVDELGARGQPPELLLNNLADEYLRDLNEDPDMAYVENEDARYIDDYGDNRFVLRSAFNDLDNPLVDDNGVDYITFATNLETVFLSRGVMDRFDTDFLALLDSMAGMNCSGGSLSGVQASFCRDLREMLLIVTSVHLTSFANASKSKLAGR